MKLNIWTVRICSKPKLICQYDLERNGRARPRTRTRTRTPISPVIKNIFQTKKGENGQ